MNRRKALLKAKRMRITDRIDLIRDEGTEEMRKGMNAVFGCNLYKPKRKNMWEERLKEGKLMVACILMKNNGQEEDHVTLEDFGGN